MYTLILKSRKLLYSSTFHVLLEYISRLKFKISFSHFLFHLPPEGGRGWVIYRAGRRLGVNWTPRSGTVAGLRAEVVIESGLFVEVGSARESE